jgi:hypothetical protein
MAPSIYDIANRRSLAERLGSLRHDQAPRWGRMTAPRMVSHLLEAYRMRNGALRIRWRFVPLRPLVKWLALYVLPFPKGAPTAPELLARKPEEWDADLAALRSVILSCEAPDASATIGDHPIFGTMSARDWGVLLHKHTEHHLRQFGV